MAGSVRFGIFDLTQNVRGLVESSIASAGECRIFVTWWRGERTLFHAAWSSTAMHEAGRVSAGPLELRSIESGARWELRHDTADMRMDLSWTAVADAGAWTLPATPAVAHEEQLGTVSGALTVRGEEISINAVGQREAEVGPALSDMADHATTCRVFAGPGRYCCASIVTVARRDHLFGWHVADGSATQLSRADVVVAHAYTGGPPLLGSIDLGVAGGREQRQTFSRGAMFSTVDAVAAGFLTRHIVFPEMTWDGLPAIGQVDQWYTDASLVRPHLVASAGAERGE